MTSPIFLIGYMGCGKTTLGEALRSFAGVDFVDLDQYIEEREHMSISSIFAQRGEDEFRRIEQEALHEVASRQAVIACGGGTPCRPGNMELMNSCGTTVWLNVPQDVLYRRLREGRAKRPLIAGKTDEQLRDFIAKSLHDREPYYSQAQYQFDSQYLETVDEVSASARNFIERFFE